jgi:hypothetical protein
LNLKVLPTRTCNTLYSCVCYIYWPMLYIFGCVPSLIHGKKMILQALRRQWFAGVRGMWTRAAPYANNLLNKWRRKYNLFCACHLLNCDEGQGQWSITGFWYIVNGAGQVKKKWTQPGLPLAYSTNASRKVAML